MAKAFEYVRLSILYLRCGVLRRNCVAPDSIVAFNSLFEMQASRAASTASTSSILSILYLRCLVFKKGKMWRERCSFNSLFEIRTASGRAVRTACIVALSILYLRCPTCFPLCSRPPPQGILSILYLRCHSAAAAVCAEGSRGVVAFNSLFEMQTRKESGKRRG